MSLDNQKQFYLQDYQNVVNKSVNGPNGLKELNHTIMDQNRETELKLKMIELRQRKKHILDMSQVQQPNSLNESFLNHYSNFQESPEKFPSIQLNSSKPPDYHRFSNSLNTNKAQKASLKTIALPQNYASEGMDSPTYSGPSQRVDPYVGANNNFQNQKTKNYPPYMQEIILTDGKFVGTVLAYGGQSPFSITQRFQQNYSTNYNRNKINHFLERNYQVQSKTKYNHYSSQQSLDNSNVENLNQKKQSIENYIKSKANKITLPKIQPEIGVVVEEERINNNNNNYNSDRSQSNLQRENNFNRDRENPALKSSLSNENKIHNHSKLYSSVDVSPIQQQNLKPQNFVPILRKQSLVKQYEPMQTKYPEANYLNQTEVDKRNVYNYMRKNTNLTSKTTNYTPRYSQDSVKEDIQKYFSQRQIFEEQSNLQKVKPNNTHEQKKNYVLENIQQNSQMKFEYLQSLQKQQELQQTHHVSKSHINSFLPNQTLYNHRYDATFNKNSLSRSSKKNLQPDLSNSENKNQFEQNQGFRNSQTDLADAAEKIRIENLLKQQKQIQEERLRLEEQKQLQEQNQKREKQIQKAQEQRKLQQAELEAEEQLKKLELQRQAAAEEEQRKRQELERIAATEEEQQLQKIQLERANELEKQKLEIQKMAIEAEAQQQRELEIAAAAAAAVAVKEGSASAEAEQERKQNQRQNFQTVAVAAPIEQKEKEIQKIKTIQTEHQGQEEKLKEEDLRKQQENLDIEKKKQAILKMQLEAQEQRIQSQRKQKELSVIDAFRNAKVFNTSIKKEEKKENNLIKLVSTNQEQNQEIPKFLMGVQQKFLAKRHDNQKEIDKISDYIETQINWSYDQITKKIVSSYRFQPNIIEQENRQILPDNIFDLEIPVQNKKTTHFYWIGSHIYYKLPQCYFEKIQYNQNPLAEIRVCTANYFGLSSKILIINSVYTEPDQNSEYYKQQLKTLHIQNIFLRLYEKDSSKQPILPFETYIFKNQRELLFLSEFQNFSQLNEIILTYREAQKSLNQSQLLYTFRLIMRTLRFFHDNNFVHGKINQKSICYLASNKSFKFFRLQEVNLFDHRIQKHQFKYFNQEDYAPPEYIKGLEFQQQNIVAFDLYAIGVCFMSLKYLLLEDDVTQEQINLKFQKLKLEQDLSSRIIANLMNPDPVERIQNSLESQILKIEQAQKSVSISQFLLLETQKVDPSTQTYLNQLQNLKYQEKCQLATVRLVKQARDMAVLYKKTFQWNQASDSYDSLMKIGRDLKIDQKIYWQYVGEYWSSLFYQNLLGEANRYSVDYFDKGSQFVELKRLCELFKISGDCQFKSLKLKEALRDYDQAIEIYQKIPGIISFQDYITIIYQQAKTYKELKDFNNKKLFFEQTLRLLKQKDTFLAIYYLYLKVLQNLKDIYKFEGAYQESFSNTFQLYQMVLMIKNNPVDSEVIKILIEGADIAKRFDQYEDARKFYSTIIENFMKSNLPNIERYEIIIKYQLQIVELHQQELLYKQAISVLEDALIMAKTNEKFLNDEINIENNIGDLYIKLEEFRIAKSHFQNALASHSKIGLEDNSVVIDCQAKIQQIDQLIFNKM